MPTLLQINLSANWGSTGKIAEQIGLLAISNDIEVFLAHGGRCINKSELNTIQIGSKLADFWHFLWNSFICGHQGLGSKNATIRLVHMIKDIKPDIIHLHNIHGYFINYKVLFEYLNTTNIPVVWTLHDPWPFTGHCGHFGSIDCDKWKTVCNNCPLKIKDYPKSLRDCSKEDFYLKKQLFSSNNNLHLVPVSNWLGDLAKLSFLGNKDIRVITNGIDLNVFKPCGYKESDKIRILGVSSQWGPLKGINDFHKLRELLTIDKYDITLVGLSDKQIEKLPKGIVGIKRTNSVQQLAELYSNSDVFVNLTYADTFPTVNIESIACGTPIITYRTGGSPEIIDEKTGIVVDKGNLEQVVKAIKEFEIRGKSFYSNSCRQRAVEFFNKDDRFQDYINLYNELLNEK